MRSLPFLIIGPFGGVFADRLDRRKMVIAVQSFLSLVVIAFAFLVVRGHLDGGLGIFYAMVFALITGALHALIQPVRKAMVANTVPKEHLWNAISLNSAATNIARVVGPGLGGVLIAWLGPGVNFFVEGILYGLMALLMLPIALPYRGEITALGSSVLTNLKQGVCYVIGRRQILRLFLTACIADILIAPIIFLLPVIADDVLGHGPRVYGLLVLATGLGGVIATVGFASLGRDLRKGSIGLLALMLLSASTLAFGLSSWLWISIGALFWLGFFKLIFKINNKNLLQNAIPDSLRGRVMSIYHLDHGITPIAGIILGLMLEFWSVNVVIAGIGLVAMVLTGWAFLAFSDIRSME